MNEAKGAGLSWAVANWAFYQDGVEKPVLKYLGFEYCLILFSIYNCKHSKYVNTDL